MDRYGGGGQRSRRSREKRSSGGCDIGNGSQGGSRPIASAAANQKRPKRGSGGAAGSDKEQGKDAGGASGSGAGNSSGAGGEQGGSAHRGRLAVPLDEEEQGPGGWVARWATSKDLLTRLSVSAATLE
jgi:hypothetical protein